MNPNGASTTTPEPAFFEGLVDRGAEKKVAMAVNVNFELKDGQKERGHAVPLHCIPLMRRSHPGGVVKVVPDWARGITRLREMTQEELKHELEGLTRSYGQKRAGEVASVLAEVYGPTEVTQLQTLHAKMAEVYRAWCALEHTAYERLQAKFPGRSFGQLELMGLTGTVITQEEMEGLVNIIEPERKELAAIQLPELASIGAAFTAAGDQSGDEDQPQDDPIDLMTAELETLMNLSAQEALAVAALIVEAGDQDPDDQKLRTVKALQKTDGSLHGTKGAQVRRIAKQYRSRVDSKTAAAPA